MQQIKSKQLFREEFQIQTATLSSNGEYLALGGSDGLIEVWNFKTMKLDTERLQY